MDSNTLNYKMWINAADEFIISYLHHIEIRLSNKEVPFTSIFNRLFLIGHSIELYIKAAYIKTFNDFPKTNHDLLKVINIIQERNPQFLNEINISNAQVEKYSLNEQARVSEPNDDLIRILKYIPDFKYPANHKRFSTFSFSDIEPNKLYAQFIKKLRGYITSNDLVYEENLLSYFLKKEIFKELACNNFLETILERN